LAPKLIKQDWFHESCLNLRSPQTTKRETENGDDDGDDDDADDDEATVLITSDTYDGLICAVCVKTHPFIRDRAGRDGWMMIEPFEGTEGFKVVGQSEEAKEEKPEREQEHGIKRSTEDEAEGPAKKPRLENGDVKQDPAISPASAGHASKEKPELKGKGDVFLAYGVREKLKSTLDVS